MWMMLDFAFLALSPSPYIRIPQPTEQYGQVLRVSVVRDNLYWRTSANAGVGEKPMRARLDPASVVAETFRNCRRDIWVIEWPRLFMGTLITIIETGMNSCSENLGLLQCN